ncbi:MAG: hypothetical protein A3F14_05660 [Gammaproteobacteria bacterium RIFCSPHIGHO2_12_FULL_43_28]|nr:MAG: hypothetical protein A3F14_05660 [Gammaproteobacteria bacterium RIFCSPHIGHO2_12_FULL_43_28]
MNSKLIGGILLVVGTTIGAGMLALPIATAQLGFWGSLVLLMSVWLVMVASAFLFLEVNLWLPADSNLVSMAGATLGKAGQSVVWVVYLILLYAILSAYLAGGGDILHYLLATQGIHLPLAAAYMLFTFLLGFVVYLGIRAVDYVNRTLMFGKMGALCLLMLFMLPFVSNVNLESGTFGHLFSATSLSVTVASFGSIMIIPSLRTYFGEDVKSLRKAIFIGMLIPLLCYVIWVMVVLGVVPLEGANGLKGMMTSSTANSDLVIAITTLLRSKVAATLLKFFTSICMTTSFLSVSLCLSDFMSDGLKVKKIGLGKVLITAITFVPPICIVLFYPDAFIRALNYGGISCFFLMILLPALMAWRGRYHFKFGQAYRVRGGKFLLP